MAVASSGMIFLAGYVCGLVTVAGVGIMLALAADIYLRRERRARTQ